MNEQRIIRAYSYSEWGDYKPMWRPDLMTAFYQKELEISGEPQFLYEVAIPFPFGLNASFYGAWEDIPMWVDRISFIKAEPFGAGAWAVYIRIEFRNCEDKTPVFRIVLHEDADGVVFKKIRITEPPIKE